MSTFILFVGYVSILSVSLDTNKIDFNDIPYKTDVYKAVVKFEVKQK